MPETLESLASRVRQLEAKMEQLLRPGLQPRALEGLLDGGSRGDALRNRTIIVGEDRWEWGRHASKAPFRYGYSIYNAGDFYGS